jgi:hypothetical protein
LVRFEVVEPREVAENPDLMAVHCKGNR